MIEKTYRSLTNTFRMMNRPAVNEAKKDTSVTIEAGKPDEVSKEDHKKKVQDQLYRIDNAEVEHESKETLDEAQFILLKKGAMTKRIRNDPDEIARAKAQGWIVSGSTNEETIPLKETEMTQEPINELSKSTLKSYVKKAASSHYKASVKADKEEDKAMSTDGEKYPDKQKRHLGNAEKEITKMRNRDKGTEMAKKKLTKEDIEQVDELSKKTLGSYTNKALNFVTSNEFKLGRMADSTDNVKYDKISDKNDKRISGIRKAVKKLTKEDIEQVDELSKKTLGSYIKKATERNDENNDEKEDAYKQNHLRKVDKISDKIKSREKNINKAVNKLTKEDFMGMSIEEAKLILQEEQAKRGRPTKDSSAEREHIVVGLRKAISLRGDHNVHFSDGSSHKVSADHASIALQRHDSHAKPSEKMAFAQKMSASHDAFKKALSEKPKKETPAKEPDKKPVTVAKKATIHLNV